MLLRSTTSIVHTMTSQVQRSGLVRPLLVGGDVPEYASSSFVLPTGTVTFLLTDIEGSTRLWETHGEVMPSVIQRHYAILDAAIDRWGGVRPVEQGEGDSIVAAFSRASDAVAAALDAQRALAAEPWPDGIELKVRMAIHSGQTQLRDEGNYVGETIIRCARVRSAGYGRQVLLSAAAAELVSGYLPPAASLSDLGAHRLKDLIRPERVFQLMHPELASDFAALRTLDQARHNLPTPHRAFGRHPVCSTRV
jgi:class 3 adenylate cyclase